MAQAVKFYTDEHVATAVAKGLHQRGIDAVTAVDANLLGATDIEHLEFAFQSGRVLFTQDHDFIRLHAAGNSHAGIAYAPQGMSIGEIVRGLLFIYQVLDADEMSGRLEYL